MKYYIQRIAFNILDFSDLINKEVEKVAPGEVANDAFYKYVERDMDFYFEDYHPTKDEIIQYISEEVPNLARKYYLGEYEECTRMESAGVRLFKQKLKEKLNK